MEIYKHTQQQMETIMNPLCIHHQASTSINILLLCVICFNSNKKKIEFSPFSKKLKWPRKMPSELKYKKT